MSAEFWREKRLSEMSSAEWESLCDGCGQCCRIKLEDVDTGAVALTGVACRLLDTHSCRCTDYEHRHARVPDCIPFDAELAGSLAWLPASCAYRRLAEGKELPQWHPLRTGDPESVHRAGISVCDRLLGERDVSEGDLEAHVVRWVSSPRRQAGES